MGGEPFFSLYMQQPPPPGGGKEIVGEGGKRLPEQRRSTPCECKGFFFVRERIETPSLPPRPPGGGGPVYVWSVRWGYKNKKIGIMRNG